MKMTEYTVEVTRRYIKVIMRSGSSDEAICSAAYRKLDIDDFSVIQEEEVKDDE